MILTKDQQKKILEIYESTPDLNEITRIVFDNPDIDGRNKEGRAIRSFMIRNNLKFKTAFLGKKDAIEFTDEQKELIIKTADRGLSSVAIAEILFPDKDINPLCLEQRAVYAVMKENNPDYLAYADTDLPSPNYVAPKSLSRVIKKINDATGNILDEAKLNRQFKTYADKLMINLNNSRFVNIMNNYINRSDRELFEQEFIRLTWDKPDLTPDEINLYMNVCKEIINLETVSKQINRLNDLFDTAQDQEDMTTRLTDAIKTKNSEYNQCATRIESLTKKLQGDRSARMQNKQKEYASILSLVQFFQDEEERANMVKIAEMQKELVRDEAKRLEGMDEWKARILGLSINDVV
jgi:hypothetical protein